MLKPLIQGCLLSAVALSFHSCDLKQAGGSLAGTQGTETVATVQAKRPVYDKAKIQAAAAAFLKRAGGQYPHHPLCLPLSGDQYLFFVTKGELTFPSEDKDPMPAHTAGLVDANGKVIVPLEMERIANPGTTAEGYVEVRKNGKYGMYSLTGALAIPIEMDAIYPYTGSSSDVLAIVRKGTQYGWADRKGGVHFDRSSHSETALFAAPDMRQAIAKWQVDLSDQKLHAFVNIMPNPYEGEDPDTGGGVVFMPSYLLQLIVLTEVKSDWMLYESDYFGMKEYYAEIKQAEQLNANTKGFIATLWEAGVSARDYSYNRYSVVTTNNELQPKDKLLVREPGNYVCSSGADFRFIGNSMIEVKLTGSSDGDNQSKYTERPYYNYYLVTADGKLQKQSTNRSFAFTKYVKINESYFQGCFSRGIDPAIDKGYDEEHNFVTTQHLSIEDLDIMRNEIFAEYGYKFTTDKWKAYFAKQSWYKGLYDNVDDKLSEIDKANVQTILNMKEKLKQNEANYLKKEYTVYVAAG